MHMRVRLAIGTAVIGLVAVTGCSSSGSSPTNATPTPTALSGTAYSLALNAISASEDQAHRQLESVLKAKSVTKIRELLLTFADDQENAVQRLLQLQPPADAASAQAQLAKALTDLSTAIRALAGQVANAKTVKQALTFVQFDEGASKAGDAVDAALNELKKLGYT